MYKVMWKYPVRCEACGHLTKSPWVDGISRFYVEEDAHIQVAVWVKMYPQNKYKVERIKGETT